MGLKEHRPGEAVKSGRDGRVETLEMTRGQDTAGTGGEGEESVGFGEGGGERFFDEDVETGLKQPAGDGGVSHRGHTDRGSVQAETGGEEIVDRGKARDAVLRRRFGESLGICVDDGGQCHGRCLSVRLEVCRAEGVENAQVIAAKGAGTDHRDAERNGHGYLALTGDSTARRQRA